MKRLTTRGRATAEAIRDREPFRTSGALSGDAHDGYYVYPGYLNADEAAALRADHEARLIDYVVKSYATPIAWHKTDGTWHIVDQEFSITTTKHQSNLYLAKRETDLCVVTGCSENKINSTWCADHDIRTRS